MALIKSTSSVPVNSSLAAVTTLYPDASYTLFVSVQNNSTNQTYSGVSPTTTFMTTYLNPSQTFDVISLSISGVTLTAKLVGNNSSGELDEDEEVLKRKMTNLSSLQKILRRAKNPYVI